MKAFTITMSDGGEWEIVRGVTAQVCRYKDTEQIGLDLGCFLNLNGVSVSKFFKINDASAGTMYTDIDVSYADKNGMRFGCIPKEEPTDTDVALVYLYPTSAITRSRFLQNALLREAKLIIEGKWYFGAASGEKINRKAFACPSILFAQKDEKYAFQFIKDNEQFIATIKFNGEEVEVVEVKKKEPFTKVQKFGSLKQVMEDAKTRPPRERSYRPTKDRSKYDEAIASALK